MRLERLGNGLRVVVAPQPQLHRAHLAVYVRVGSRFETPKTNGLSHFLEHMLYRGTPRLRNAHEVNLAVESVGGYLYAATQVDFGVFSVTMPPESVPAATALFGEILTEPTFADIGIEKEIVCEEILEDLDDDGRQVDADNLSRKLIYPTHALGYTITGDEKNVRSFTREMCAEHHARHYSAENCVLVYSGAVNPDEAFTAARAAFEPMRRGARLAASPPADPQKKARRLILENVSSQTELRISFRGVSDRAPERAAMEMLMRILDDGMSTRLYHRVCDDKGLCYDVTAAYDGYEDDGILDFAAGCQHSRTSVVTKEILDLLAELGRTGPTDDELAKAKKRYGWDARAMLDGTDEVAALHGVGHLFERPETIDERRARMESVTKEQIRDVAALIAQPDRLNAVAVGLLDDGEDDRFEAVIDGFKGA
jgi:predicted Zn-dependent peptidase